MKILSVIRWVVTLAVLLSAHPAPAQATTQLALPPECTTRTRIENTPFERAWVYVMNFRVGRTGCLIYYDKNDGNLWVGYTSLGDTCKTFGDVDFSYGRAVFRGGYLACKVNVMEAVRTISSTVPITEEARLQGFYLLGRGLIADIPRTPENASGVIASYDPDDPEYSRVTLRVNVTNTLPGHAHLSAFFNKTFHTDTTCAVPVGQPEQVWVFTRNEGQLKFWEGGTQLCPGDRPRAPVRLRQDGATIYIGGLPGGDRFYGVIDEVILDPFGGGRPPTSEGENPEGGRVLLPVTVR
jgi:hypothetical protein